MADLQKGKIRVTAIDPLNTQGRSKSRKAERVVDVVAEFERMDYINWLYRDTQDQSWRGKTRRGRAVSDG